MIRFTDCAKYYREKTHQVNAWNYLQNNVDDDVLEHFAHLYRTDDAPDELVSLHQLAEIWECAEYLIETEEITEPIVSP